MLQMLNVDVKKGGQTYNPEQGGTDNEGGSGDEEFRSSATNLGKKNLILPQLRGSNHQANLNNSVDDNMKIDDENIGIMEENKNDNNRPKM
jgi:hypothetical protein